MRFTGKQIIVAPLAGITDTVFRRLCRNNGADIVYSEMVSAEGIVHGAKNTAELLSFYEHERPIGIQLFGTKPESLAYAVRYVQDRVQPDFIDLNCGCPVPKVVKKNGGAGLLRDPVLFRKIVSAMIEVARVPITVKLRSGWHEHKWVDVEFAAIAQDCGVAAVALHPRSKTMMFGKRAYWDRIGEIKQRLTVPVIGNGDIRSGDDAVRMFRETGCDSIMVGRACMGNPWIFGAIRGVMDGKPISPPTLEDRLKTARTHLTMYRDEYGEFRAAKEMKKHIAWYLKGIPGSAEARRTVFTAQTTEQLEEVLLAIEGRKDDGV